MSKNGSRTISIGQYRLTDLFLFAVILALGELFPYLALKNFAGGALFTLSFMVPITLIVMMRWGWPSVFYAAASGVIYCLLNGGAGYMYAEYGIGNAFIALMLIPLYLVGKQKISSHWWASALFAVAAWLCVYLGRSVVFAVVYAISPMEGVTALSGFVEFIVADSFSCVMAVVIILVIRRFDGMFEDQKAYLIRRRRAAEEKMRNDAYGDQLEELDDEALKILNRDDNDLYL